VEIQAASFRSHPFPAAGSRSAGESLGSSVEDLFTFSGEGTPQIPGATQHLLKMTSGASPIQAGTVSTDQAAKAVLQKPPAKPDNDMDEMLKCPDKIWEFPMHGPLTAAPALDSDGILYVGTYEGKLHAVKDGHELWSFDAGAQISYYPRVAPDGKTVIFGSGNKKIHAVRDGVKQWDFETGDLLPNPSCIGADGTVYLANHEGKTVAVKDGKKLWEYEGLSYAFPSCAGPDGTAYVGQAGKNLYALKDGKIKWHYEAEDWVGYPSLGPDGTVYVTLRGKKLCAIKEGVKLWDCDIDSPESARPIVGPDGVVYMEGKHDFPCICAVKDGKKLWEYKINNTGGSDAALGPDGTLYVANYFMEIFMFKDGQKVHGLRTGEILLGPPSVGPDGTAYIVGGTGRLMAFSPNKEPVKPEIPEIADEEKARISAEDQWIIIDGVKLEKRMRLLASSFSHLPGSPYCR
jgi:outer membrane protein assembly factor BamB